MANNFSKLSYYDNSTITQLNGAISSTPTAGATTSVTVDSTYGLHVSQYLIIDSEEMTVSSITNATTVVLTRGVNGTTVATHADDASVKSASLWQDVVVPGTTLSSILSTTIVDNLGSPLYLRVIISNSTTSPFGGSGGASQGAYTPVFQSFTPVRLRDVDSNRVLFTGFVNNIKEHQSAKMGMTLELQCYDQIQELRDNTTSGDFAFTVDTSQALSKFSDFNDANRSSSTFTHTSAASSRGGLIKSFIAQNSNADNITFSGDSNRFTESVRKFQDSFTYQLGERNKKSILAHIRELSNDDPTVAAGGNFGFDYYGDPNFTSTATNHKPALFFNYFIRANRPSTEPEKYNARFAQPYSGFLETGRSKIMEKYTVEKPKEEIFTDAKVTFPSFSNSTTNSRSEKTIDFELLQISDYSITQYTTLNEALDDSETGIDVSDASSGNSASQAIIAGMTIRVDDEEMYVSSVSSNTLTVVRGVNFTTAAAHDNSTAVKSAFTWGNPNLLIDSQFYGSSAALDSPEVLDVQLTQLNEVLDATETDIIVDSNVGMYVNQIIYVAPTATAGAREFMKVTAINSNGTQITVERDGLDPTDTTGVTHVDNSYVFAYSVASMQYISRMDITGGNDITASAPAFVMISSVDKAFIGTTTRDKALSAGSVVRGHYNRQTTFTILTRPKATLNVKRTLNMSLGSSTHANNVREEVAARLMRSSAETTRGSFTIFGKPEFYVDATPTAVGSSSSATVQGSTKYTETLTFGKLLVTTLNEALDDSETAIDVTSSDEMYVGQTFQIDSEKFAITAINSSTNISANRGEASTTAAEHDTGTQIYDISANPLNFGIRVGTTLSELDSDSQPTTTYGYASAVTSTQVTGTWDTGQISTSSVVRYYVPIRAGDVVRLRNDLTNTDANFLVTRTNYYEQAGINYTNFDIVARDDSNTDYPVQRLTMNAKLAEAVATASNLPSTAEVQGATSSSEISPNPIASLAWMAPGVDNAYMFRLQADATIGGKSYLKGDMLFVNITTGDLHFSSDVKSDKTGAFDLGDKDGANWNNLYVEAVAFESTSNTYEEFAGIQAPANYSSGNSDTARYVLTLPSSAPSADSFIHTNSSGVLTFVAASSVGGAALANDGNNRIVTATGSGGINGESTFTYDGSLLTLTGSGEGATQAGGTYAPSFIIESSNTTDNNGPALEIYSSKASATDQSKVGYINFFGKSDNGTKVEVAHIAAMHYDVSASSRDARIYFRIAAGAGGTTANYDAYLSETGVWTDASDAATKTYEGTAHSIYGGTDGKVITDKIKSLDIGRYYKKGTPSDKLAKAERHISPTAQDWYAIFGTGENPDTSDAPGIAAKDLGGVALMAIKELITRVEALES